MQTVYLGADHAGFHLKQSIKDHLEHKGFYVEDLGAHNLDPSDDYPKYSASVAKSVREHPGSHGILLCANAQGVCMVANKFDGVRAGVGFSKESAITMRQDDNANVICIPGRIKTVDDPIQIVDAFLNTQFSKLERHSKRIEMLTQIEKNEQPEPSIIPTLLVQNEEIFKSRINNAKIRRVSKIWQLDVLDNTFVDAISWHDPISIGKMENLPAFELHLMVSDPVPIIESWKAHVQSLKRAYIHIEIKNDLHEIIGIIKNLGIEVGISINPETPAKALKKYANQINRVLIMGVNPGSSGQKFIGKKILKKIKKIHKKFPHINIAVDGGINRNNAIDIFEAGAKTLCVSSAIWDSADPQMAIDELIQLSPT